MFFPPKINRLYNKCWGRAKGKIKNEKKKRAYPLCPSRNLTH